MLNNISEQFYDKNDWKFCSDKKGNEVFTHGV